MNDTFATESDRQRVARLNKIYTWKVIVERGTTTLEWRTEARTIDGVISKFRDRGEIIEIKRMKR